MCYQNPPWIQYLLVLFWSIQLPFTCLGDNKPNKCHIGLGYIGVVNFHVLEYSKPMKFVSRGTLNNIQFESSTIGQPCEIDNFLCQSKSTCMKTHKFQTYHYAC